MDISNLLALFGIIITGIGVFISCISVLLQLRSMEDKNNSKPKPSEHNTDAKEWIDKIEIKIYNYYTMSEEKGSDSFLLKIILFLLFISIVPSLKLYAAYKLIFLLCFGFITFSYLILQIRRFQKDDPIFIHPGILFLYTAFSIVLYIAIIGNFFAPDNYAHFMQRIQLSYQSSSLFASLISNSAFYMLIQIMLLLFLSLPSIKHNCNMLINIFLHKKVQPVTSKSLAYILIICVAFIILLFFFFSIDT